MSLSSYLSLYLLCFFVSHVIPLSARKQFLCEEETFEVSLSKMSGLILKARCERVEVSLKHGVRTGPVEARSQIFSFKEEVEKSLKNGQNCP